MNQNDHEWYMKLALEEANKAYRLDEVPVGAVIVDETGKVIAKAHNLKEKNNDPLGHAEIIAIKKASEELKAWRLKGCTLYVTLEPCNMCLGAMVHARIDHLVFGAYDNKAGALGLGYLLHKDKRLNHKFKVTGGIYHYPCSKVLSDFFKSKRQGYNVMKK